MAYSAHVGSFNIDTSKTAGQDQSVTGVGFQPKIVLFWWSGSTAAIDTVAGGNIMPGFGAAIDSSSRRVYTAFSEDAAVTSNVFRDKDNDAVVKLYTGAASLDGIADFKSMDADGFTLTIDDQFTVDWRISYLALGGDDLTNVYIGDARQPNATGNYSITGVGFQPDALITFGAATYNMTETSNYFRFNLGWATGSGNQGVVAIDATDNSAKSVSRGYCYNGEFYGMAYAVDVGFRGSLVSLDADGFTANHLESTNQWYYFFIALKGGQYSVGELATATDGSDITEVVGFRPAAILFASANRALSTQDTPTDHARLSIGAATSTSNRAVQAISDEDDLADTETAFANYDSAVYAHVVDDAIVGLMDLKSIDADGFTAVMDDADPSACWVTYLAIGATAAAGNIMQLATVAWANAGQYAGVAKAAIAQIIGVTAN